MKIPAQLECLYTGELTEESDSYQVEVPKNEIELGNINPAETYRIAILPSESPPPVEKSESTDSNGQTWDDHPQPPVVEGETRVVTIEDVGDQGDGITRVERGFVVIVPEATKEETVEIEIESVKQNVAFATVIDRKQF